MEYLKLNKSRHAVKHFDGSRIATVDVKQIISTAVLAPSAHNLQPWFFAIVDSNEKRQLLIDEVEQGNASQLEQAGAIIVVFSDTAISERSREIAQKMGSEMSPEMLQRYNKIYPERFSQYSPSYTSDYLALNAGIITMNLVLAINDMGYKSNIILGFHKTDHVNEALGVPLRYRPEIIITLGRSEEKGEPHLNLPADMMFKIV
ncbi:MAG: nitroreductase family protein [Streptococcaceae bacterium]|jgi:nitroreductase|nr:nitroreductase family protein [Streptococcaceae bacterium]